LTELAEFGESWSALAGPTVFGRSLLLVTGAVAPAPWSDCNRIRLSEETIVDPATLRIVQHAFFTRTPIIYEIDVGLKKPAPASDSREVWEVFPNLDLVAEATWRLATSNAVDGRDLDHPHWPLAARAVHIGAVRGANHDADVVLPDGSPVWCDGGPLHLWPRGAERLKGFAVVPGIAIVAGRLTPIAADSPTAVLAPDQLLAVADPSPKARIIAPAGSGKTRVLTERARHVLDSGVSPESLLLVAYNKRAQEEMRARTTDHPGLQVQTLNALALSILNGTNGFASRGGRVQTINEIEVRNIIFKFVKFPRRANTDPAAAWIEALSMVRLGLQSPSRVEAAFGGDVEGFADFFPRYRHYLADHNQVDFDEQIYLALEMLLRDWEVRLAAEKRAEVLLVDEFQDLTPAHMLLMRLLAGPQLSIFAVGDDDQTIYGYSGATPEWLVEFEEHVPEAVHHALEVNYRCPAPVVAAASNLMSHNTVRVAKQVRPGPDNVTSPESLKVIKVQDQVQCATERIQTLLADGVAPSEIAVLTRVNSLLAPVQISLAEAGIPVNVRDGGNILKDQGVVAALAWLRIALQPEYLQDVDISLAARRPGRGLSPRVMEWMGEQTTVEGLSRLAGRISDVRSSEKVAGFVRDVERIATLAERESTSNLIQFIQSEIGLDSALATLDASHQGRNTASYSDGLRSLITIGRRHTDPKTFEAWLRRSLAAEQDDKGVVLATVHRVKGLEWPHVLVFDASSGIFPHRLSVDIEEERRVFHVAITRCKKSLTIIAEADAPSLFLHELAVPGQPTPKVSRDVAQRLARSSNKVPRSESGGVSGASNQVAVAVGLRFTWGGYDCVVRAVNIEGVVATTSEREITVAFGAEVQIKGHPRTLGRHKPTWVRGDGGSSTEVNTRIFAALKSWRLEQSKADKVPAYVVFNDKTLDELSRACPRTVPSLLGIVGIGPAKADRYGDQILAVIEASLQ
jgi:DNA helicase-2/ATP-dependent DNA helicase PcrA